MHTALTPIDSARQAIADRLIPLSATEAVPLADALGRIAAETIHAPANLPAQDNAAVDGYGVRLVELEADPQRWFAITATVKAGHPHEGEIALGCAAALYTGGIMPMGPDCVFMHEVCTLKDGHVQIAPSDKPYRRGLNIRPAGENLRRGEICLGAGRKISPQDIGQLAAAQINTVLVQKRLRVRVLSTGDEVANPRQAAAGTAQVADANGPMLQGLLAGDGHLAQMGGIIPDNREALSAAFGAGLEDSDVLITTGGASDGIEDHTQAAMADNQVDCLFWRLAMKPGRPMAVGMKAGKLVICLPGNPVAVFVCYRLLVSGWLDQLLGGAGPRLLSVPVAAGFAHSKRKDRAEYLRVRLEVGADGAPTMQLHGRKGAGVISSLQGADGLVEIPLDREQVAIGDMLPFLPFRERGL